MQGILLVGLSRELALKRELDVVANNVANIDTTGYKADGALFESYLSPATAGQQGTPISFAAERGTWLDTSAGPTKHTGNPLDVAVDGKGFFAVQTAQGVRYTRDGSFQLDAQGRVVTADGDPVLGDSGPIQLQPNDHQISISRDGTISVRAGASNVDTQRGKLRLVRFPNPSQLSKQGGSLFSYNGTGQPPNDSKSRVVQGAIEQSNVHGVMEMSRMIDITRSYQQVANMMQQQSDLGTTAIDKLAAVPN